MAIGSVSSAVASQFEHTRDILEELTQLQGVLWKRINKSADVTSVSNRPARIPFVVEPGGAFRVGSFDGAGMGRGSGPVQAFGNLSAVSFLQATEYTALAEYSTDSTEKAVENYVTKANEDATAKFAAHFDALVANSDGSNLLDTVVSVSGTTGLVVSNPNAFLPGQPVDFCASPGDGTLIASNEVLSVDPANNTVWFKAAVAPVTTGAGMYPSGSAMTANSGLFGLPYYQVMGNTGNFMGILRTTYPAIFSTPGIAGPVSLTPAVVRAAQAACDAAMGIDASDDEVVAHMNTDMSAAWENNALTVQSIIANQVQGDSTTDMLRKRQSPMIAGREILKNTRAKPGRIDFLNLKHWFKLETKAVDRYEVGGQTLFPTIASDGGLNSSVLFYLVAMFQIGNGQPRKSFMIGPSVTIPAGYFGH